MNIFSRHELLAREDGDMRGYEGARGEGHRGGDVLDVDGAALAKLLVGVERRVGVGGGELVDLYVGEGAGTISSVGVGRLLQDVGRLLEQSTPFVRAVVGDDGSSLGWSGGDVDELLEESSPIIGYHLDSICSRRRQNEDARRGLARGVMLG